MAWTTPKTFSSGAALTAAEMNEQVRDNLAYLKARPIIDVTYEEGSWTPAFAATSGTPATITSAGRYQRVGNTVTVSCVVQGNIGSASSGNVTITGLPFTASAALNWSAHVGYADGWTNLTGFTLTGLVFGGQTVITLYAFADGGTAPLGYTALPAAGGAATPCVIYVTVTYQI